MAAEAMNGRSSGRSGDRLACRSCVTKTGGRHPLILDPVACPAGQDPGRPPNLRPCPDRCRSPYVLLPVRGKSLSGPRGADGQRRLACKLLLVHHEDGVESTVRVGLDRDVERVALPSPIDDVAVPVTPGRQRDRKSTRLNSSHPSISYAV